MMSLVHGKGADTVASQVPAAEVITNILSQKNFTFEQFGYHANEVERVLPVSAGQTYMLSAWQSTKGQVFFPEFEFTVRGPVGSEAVREAWSHLTECHDILRTVFCATEDHDVPLVQLVLRKHNAYFVDLDSNQNLEDDVAQQPFARLSVSKVNGGLRIGLKLHHALYDAISLPLLIEDLQQRLSTPVEPSHPQKFADFLALGLREDVAKRRQIFWRQYLGSADILQLPATSDALASGRVEIFDPSTMPITAQSEATLRKQGINVQALFFAAYARAYTSIVNSQSSSASKDVVLGIYLANRSHLDELSSLVAPTVNLVPLRVRNPKETSLISSARQIQEDLLSIGTLENSSVSLWEIYNWTGVKVDTIVNFIKLPDTHDEGEQRDAEGAIVVEEAQNGHKTAKRSLVHDVDTAEFKQPKQLERNLVQDAYPVSYLVPKWSMRLLLTDTLAFSRYRGHGRRRSAGYWCLWLGRHAWVGGGQCIIAGD